jgi:hypothetical protein
MKPHHFRDRARCVLWLILPLLAFTPAAARAGDITFKNETKVNLVVQGATFLNIQKNILKSGPALKVEPGKSVTDFNVPAAPRVIQIFDPLGRRLYRRELPYDGSDVTVEIRIDPRTGGIVLAQPAATKKN